MLGAAGLERAEGGGVSLLTMLRNMSGTLQLVDDPARPGHVLLWRADSPTNNPVPSPKAGAAAGHAAATPTPNPTPNPNPNPYLSELGADTPGKPAMG